MTTIETALYYADHGLAVLPLLPQSNSIATTNGITDATTDHARIEQWWSEDPCYHIGIATGSISGGLIAIELTYDPKSNSNGYQSTTEFKQEYGTLPETISIFTATLDFFSLYRVDHLIQSAKFVRPGINLYGENDYIIAPSIIGPVNGLDYQWRQSASLDSFEPAIADALVYQFIQPDTGVQPAQRCQRSRKSVSGATQPIKGVPPLTAISAADLLKKDIPPIEWLTHGLLTQGLAILAAPAKYYKSFMALQLCVAICTGGSFLGFNCEKRACLYLDLESTERRPLSRLTKIAGKSAGTIDNLYIITGQQNVKSVSEGFEDQIREQVRQHPDIGLVIVDVFQLIRHKRSSKQNAYEGDYEELKTLKKLADELDIALLLVHHTRKMETQDPFDKMSGSTAMLGAMDCAWTIEKSSRDTSDAILHVTGRDLESKDLRICFCKSSCRWEYVSTDDEYQISESQKEYTESKTIKVIRQMTRSHDGHWTASASEIRSAGASIGVQITDAPQRIGKDIIRFSWQLRSIDQIDVSYSRTAQERQYTFKSIVTDVIDVTNDIGSVDMDDSSIHESQPDALTLWQ